MNLHARLRKTFETGFALEVDQAFQPGFTIVFGASGAGKTTFIDCLAGLTTPEEGQIDAFDRVLLDTARNINVPTHQRRAGYVLQSQALFPHLTVEENLAFGLRRDKRAAVESRIKEFLSRIDLSGYGHRKPAQLSAGQRQRVALARTLLTDPCFLLMDEPLAALDAATKAKLIEVLRDWNRERQIPILYVTHDREEAYSLGETMIVMEQGRIVAAGAPQDVLRAPKRNTIARLAGFENTLECEAVSDHVEQGTMSLRVVGTEVVLEAPLAHLETPHCTLGIRAGDILVASAPPQGISARNILLGRIASIEQQGVLVRLYVNVQGAKFEAHVTPGAQVALRLSGGTQVWLVIKTYSCHLLTE